ncbi:exocyst complex component 3-like protein 4 isoform X2 [Seriola aureovittata]|uniref:exocyst complex component 3-like protein 4 isoform X2 n=1 Tax=Seriola aureovittata TaxID=2871759 RepID=UPI0024BE2133|nr:exocyst complex component 3-like protein 4 isoform X2 [Seriola aureovittata]
MKNLFKGRNKVRRNESRTPLMKENNNNVEDGYNQADNAVAQHTSNTHKEREFTLQELAEFLGVDLPNTFEDGCWCTVQPGQHNLNLNVIGLIQKSVVKHLPKPPSHLDENLHQHLLHVQDAVLHELVRLGPQLERMGLMGCLIDCYHHQTFEHLHILLQNATTAKNTFVLMNWVQCVYPSKELLGHPDLQEIDPIGKVDVLLFKEWDAKAKDKLLENVQKSVRESLKIILQNEMAQDQCDCEETYVGLYVDIIQCINAMHNETKKISSELPDGVKEVCFQELLMFLKRYVTEQTKALGKKAKMDKPETIYFLRTLTTCKELKQYVQTEGAGIKPSLLNEMVGLLENMEASTFYLLKDIVTDIAESHLKKYFKSNNKQFLLCAAVQNNFPKLQYGLDEQKRVMDEAYKLIVRIYIKNLVRSSQRKLKKHWSPNVGQTVIEDAELLHSIMSDLAPGVQQRNFTLLKITEILECNSVDTLKMECATMQNHCLTMREDMELLPTVLRWKGLSKRKVNEVLYALPPDLQPGLDPDRQPSRTRSWCCCFN